MDYKIVPFAFPFADKKKPKYDQNLSHSTFNRLNLLEIPSSMFLFLILE